MTGALERSGCAYCALYCEENVWKLAQDARLPEARRSVLLISNPTRSVAMRAQRAGDPERGGLVVWDYHVVLALQGERGVRVYDLDSLLPFPCPLDEYVRTTFGAQSALPPALRALVRIVEAEDYVRQLRSDRSHMRNAEGEWLAAPPPWDAPAKAERAWPLPELMDMTRGQPGQVVAPGQLAETLR